MIAKQKIILMNCHKELTEIVIQYCFSGLR